MTAPLVTAIATCYNHARFVEECLDSIAAQEYPNVQLIVMDDASTDDSVAVIRRWIERTGVECELVVHAENMGLVPTRNDAIALAHGKYVATVSTDDLWLPGKLRQQVEIMEQRPNAALVYSDCLEIDPDGTPTGETYLGRYGRQGVEGYVHEDILEADFIPPPTIMIRRSSLEEVGPYDESLSFEGWDMMLRLSAQHEFAFCPDVTAKKRVLPVSAVHILGDEFTRSFVDVQRKHLGYSREWDDRLIRRSAIQAYGWRHPKAREYLREAVKRLGWRDEVAFYYVLDVLQVSPVVLAYIFPVRAIPQRAVKRLWRALSRPLRPRRYSPESQS